MALLEKISSMKQSGMNDYKIAANLMEEGYSPREVSEALSQSKIKAAISQEDSSDMQQSISADSSTAQYSSIPNYSQQQTIEAPEQQAQQYPVQYQEQYTQQQGQEAYNPNAAYQQQYPQEAQQGYYQQAIDLETVRDIARQQVEEALKKLREQVETLSKSKTEMNFHIQDIENRMQRVEAVIQDIQRAVLKRMGEYGEAISGISNEIRATQQSFAKLVNPILDNKRGISPKSEEQRENSLPQQKSKQSPQQQNQKHGERPRPNQSKNSATFEDYFR